GGGLDFWGQCWLTVGVILGLAVVNVLGVRWGGGLQLFITIIKVASLLGIILLPVVVLLLRRPGVVPSLHNLAPVWPPWNAWDFSKFGAAVVAVLWAYRGWMDITPVAEEIHHPQRNIPLALLGGAGIIVLLYLGAN